MANRWETRGQGAGQRRMERRQAEAEVARAQASTEQRQELAVEHQLRLVQLREQFQELRTTNTEFGEALSKSEAAARHGQIRLEERPTRESNRPTKSSAQQTVPTNIVQKVGLLSGIPKQLPTSDQRWEGVLGYQTT